MRFIGSVLFLFSFSLINCKIDIRQLPFPKKITNYETHNDRKNVYVRNFIISNPDLKEIESAWQYTFVTFLQEDILLAKKFNINKDNLIEKDSISIDVKIKPTLIEKRNHWWSLPFLFPFSLVWPIQFREINYIIEVEYTIENNDSVHSETFTLSDTLTIYFYGLTRTEVYEDFIQKTNKRVIEKCVSKISLYLSQY